MILYRNGKKIIERVEIADGFFKRIKGLLGRKIIENEYGLFFPFCNFVHTFFMRTNIDIVMVDRNFKVIYIKQSVKPFNFAFCFRAFHVFEFARGTVKKKEIKTGDLLKIEHGN